MDVKLKLLLGMLIGGGMGFGYHLLMKAVKSQ
jgi:hypothetical protein